jgi:hypothetical protein
MIHFSELPTEQRNNLIATFTLPLSKEIIYVDKFNRPFEKTSGGRIYCNRKREYQYAIVN